MQRLRDLLAPLLARVADARARATMLRDRGSEIWGRLTPRDQQLVSWLSAAGGTLLLVGTVALCSSHLKTLRHAIDTRTKQLAQVREMHGRYSEEKSTLDALSSRLKTSSQPPRTFLEEKARESNVSSSLDGMRDLAAPPNDFFKSQVIEVKLKKVTIANVTRFLHKIESTGVGMTVRSLHLETNFQDPKYLNATVEVLALRSKE
ncbi:MAG TPA: hypothetical protein VMV18_06480, partial [bacterium]|nr:hypothetical protein [bacterium]